MREKLTAARVAAFKPADDKDRDYLWDSSLAGFGVMATATGKKSYVIQYRAGGRSRRMKLDYTKNIDLDAARKRARGLLGGTTNGSDPLAERQQQVAAFKAGRQDLFPKVAEQYIERHAKKHLRWWRELDRTLKHDVVPIWGRKAISDITEDDAKDLLDEVKERAPIQANRVLAALRMLFKWCVDQRKLKASPVAALRTPTPETARDRVLTDDELRAVWQAAAARPYPFGPCIRLLILTAQRRDEVAGLRWTELDLDQATWILPGARAKNSEAHEVQLSAQAVELLRSLPRIDGCDLVFTTTGKTKISGWSKVKSELDEASGVRGWVVHDLRRTTTTGMARLGIPPHVADKVLNHRQGTIKGVARVYNRFQYQAERRDALQAWANFVDAIVERRSATSNVVDLRTAGGAA